MNRNPNGGTLLENNEKKTEQMRVDQVVKRIDKKIISTDEELKRAHAENKKVQQN